MPKGGHNRLPEAVKRARGTFEPGKHRAAPVPEALAVWPTPPVHFEAGEILAWSRLGESVMALGAASRADLLMATYCAQIMARLDAALAAPGTKVAAIASLLRLASEQLRAFGLTPAARASVQPLKPGEIDDDEDEDPLDEFDTPRSR